jgi:hypothetical protein
MEVTQHKRSDMIIIRALFVALAVIAWIVLVPILSLFPEGTPDEKIEPRRGAARAPSRHLRQSH